MTATQRTAELTNEMMDALGRPFAAELVKWKPQATTRDKARALAVPYVAVRDYVDRLNEVAGPNWSDDYEVLEGGAVVICRLTVGGVTRSDVGEADTQDLNTATSAIAQAFKRACVKFGLGAYLYRLPQRWEEYDAQRRTFTEPAKGRLRRLAEGQGTGLRYADGSALSDNPAEVQAYQAHIQATGQTPANITVLRQWLADRP